MKFSIVTASYNQGRYIRDCIESVRPRPEIECEHIIVDACSTDETLSVLKSYPDLRWVSEPDKGQSDAINKGFRMATNEWTVWLNADDYLLPGALECFADIVQKHPEANYAYGHTLFVDEMKRPIRTVFHLNHRPGLVKFGSHVPPSTGSLFRTALMQQNPLNLDFHFLMDLDWLFRCRHLIRSVRVDRPMVAFRLSSDNKTGSMIQHGEARPRHMEEHHLLRQQYGCYSIVEKDYPWSIQRRALRVCFRSLYYMLKARFALRFLTERAAKPV